MSDPWSLFGTTVNGVLTTQKRDGRPQLSNVSYLWDPEPRILTVSVTDDRAKTRNLRRDPRASFYVTTPDLGAYAVGEGEAELGEVTRAPDDDAADALVAHYRALRGEHPDWDDFRAAMVAQRRLLLRLPLTRVYGWVPDGN
ncbi:TIGR03618 family F420-dependent PPOX class oxidoreductase [Streptomyces sp. NPDC047002]|uniref:TIGR03618 family F420-dependent PPOX class oxidoreductase n=1 Tax=Streptomyces sp. NPDC047002 TaxID=3155475 RepID=UPI0034526F60